MRKKFAHRKKWLLTGILLMVSAYATAETDIWSRPDKIDTKSNDWIPVIGKCLTCKPSSDLDAQATNEQIGKVLSPPLPNTLNLSPPPVPLQLQVHKQPRLLNYNPPSYQQQQYNIPYSEKQQYYPAVPEKQQQYYSPVPEKQQQYYPPVPEKQQQYYSSVPEKYYPQDLSSLVSVQQPIYHFESNPFVYQSQPLKSNSILEPYKNTGPFNVPQQIFLPQTFPIGGPSYSFLQQPKLPSAVLQKSEVTTPRSTTQSKIRFPDNNDVTPKKQQIQSEFKNRPNIPEVHYLSKKPSQNIQSIPEIQLLYVPVEALQRGRNVKVTDNLSGHQNLNIPQQFNTPRPYNENLQLSTFQYPFPQSNYPSRPENYKPEFTPQINQQYDFSKGFSTNEHLYSDKTRVNSPSKEIEPPYSGQQYVMSFGESPVQTTQKTTYRTPSQAYQFSENTRLPTNFNLFSSTNSQPPISSSTEKYTSSYSENLFQTSPQQFSTNTLDTSYATTVKPNVQEELSRDKFKPQNGFDDVRYSLSNFEQASQTYPYQVSLSQYQSTAIPVLEGQHTTQLKFRPLPAQNAQQLYTFSTSVQTLPPQTSTSPAPPTTLLHQSQQYPQEPTTYEEPNYPVPHQPPLSVYMEKYPNSKINDILNLLRDSKTIPVLDTVELNAPQVFVGPSELQPPKGYAKFDLPYLSSLDSNRIERMIDRLPFFVAPLNFKPPLGYSKIPFPAPHIGSVVVSNTTAFEEVIPDKVSNKPSSLYDNSQPTGASTYFVPQSSTFVTTPAINQSPYTPQDYFERTEYSTVSPETPEIASKRLNYKSSYRSTTEYPKRNTHRQRKPVYRGFSTTETVSTTTSGTLRPSSEQDDYKYQYEGSRFNFDYPKNEAAFSTVSSTTLEPEPSHSIILNSQERINEPNADNYQLPHRFQLPEQTSDIPFEHYNNHQQNTFYDNARNVTIQSELYNSLVNNRHTFDQYSSTSSPNLANTTTNADPTIFSSSNSNDKEYSVYNSYNIDNGFSFPLYYNTPAPYFESNETNVNETQPSPETNFQNVKSLSQFKPSIRDEPTYHQSSADVYYQKPEKNIYLDYQPWQQNQFYTNQEVSQTVENSQAPSSPAYDSIDYFPKYSESSSTNNETSFASSSTSSADYQESYNDAYRTTTSPTTTNSAPSEQTNFAPTKSKQRNRYSKYSTTPPTTANPEDYSSTEYQPRKNGFDILSAKVSPSKQYGKDNSYENVSEMNEKEVTNESAADILKTSSEVTSKSDIKYRRRRPVRPSTSTSTSTTETPSTVTRSHRVRIKQQPVSSASTESIRSRIRRPSIIATTTAKEIANNNWAEYDVSSYAQSAPGSNEIISSSENKLATSATSNSKVADDAVSHWNEPVTVRHQYNNQRTTDSWLSQYSSREDVAIQEQEQTGTGTVVTNNISHKAIHQYGSAVNNGNSVTVRQKYNPRTDSSSREEGVIQEQENSDKAIQYSSPGNNENFAYIPMTNSAETSGYEKELPSESDAPVSESNEQKKTKEPVDKNDEKWTNKSDEEQILRQEEQKIQETEISKEKLLKNEYDTQKKYDPQNEKKDVSSRRRGTWVRKIRVKRPQDVFEAAESQHLASVSDNAIKTADLKTTAPTKVQNVNVVDSKQNVETTTPGREDFVGFHRDFTDMLTELLANKQSEQKNEPFPTLPYNDDTFNSSINIDEEQSTSYEVSNSSKLETREVAISGGNIDGLLPQSTNEYYEEKFTATEPTTLDTSEIKISTSSTDDANETIPSKVIGTSTTTEISLETEICYRGKCVKSKKTKASDLLPVE